MNAWRSIPGFPAYEVNASGRVRSALTGYVLTPRKGVVSLQRDGRGCRCSVRDLVAAAWPAKAKAANAETAKLRKVAAKLASVRSILKERETRAAQDATRARAALLDLAAEYDCLIKERDALDEENHLLARVAAMAVPADGQDAELIRLQSHVAELEAELALYRVSASI